MASLVLQQVRLKSLFSQLPFPLRVLRQKAVVYSLMDSSGFKKQTMANILDSWVLLFGNRNQNSNTVLASGQVPGNGGIIQDFNLEKSQKPIN
jgi:hypothetical protein